MVEKVYEKYFILYDVDHDTWSNFVTMQFTSNAALGNKPMKLNMM
jgi:hypothetical protein